LTFADIRGVGVSRIAISARRIVVATDATRALVSLRQHFLKRDAVFFEALVYSR
jgi:hypothetical protein